MYMRIQLIIQVITKYTQSFLCLNNISIQILIFGKCLCIFKNYNEYDIDFLQIPKELFVVMSIFIFFIV